MRNITFDCVVTCDFTPSLQLQQQEVTLKQAGKQWSGSITVGLDHLLLVYCRVAGVSSEAWSIAVATNCPTGTPDKIYQDSDKIPHGGSYAFYTSAKVPDAVCGKPSAPELDPPEVKPSGSPRLKKS